MTRRGVVASVLLLFMFGGPWRAAMAEPVLYTIEFVASGTVGDEPFVDEPIVVAGVTDTGTIQQIIDNVPSNGSDVQQLLSALSLVAGLGFIVAAFFKFHQHKQNPTQLVLGLGVSFTAPLTTLVARDGSLVTLSIDSIHDNQVEFRTHRAC